jgi:branched-chain amino acid transport system permease protein
MDCLSLREPLFLASQIITGLATGGVYALVALGLVLIYKASDVINFAQGDLLMLGAYIGWALTTAGLPFPLAFVLTLGLAAVAGLLIEHLVLRRMIGEPIIAVIIVTLGLSSMLRGLVFFVAGTELRRFPDDVLPSTPLQLGPLQVLPIFAWAFVIVAIAVLVLSLFFRFSRPGIALRAAADDQQAAM